MFDFAIFSQLNKLSKKVKSEFYIKPLPNLDSNFFEQSLNVFLSNKNGPDLLEQTHSKKLPTKTGRL